MPPIPLLPHIEWLRVNLALVESYLNRGLFLDELVSEPIGLGVSIPDYLQSTRVLQVTGMYEKNTYHLHIRRN